MLPNIFNDQDLVSYIKQLDIYTKKLVTGPLVGDWKTKQRGSGFEFEQLRDYQAGDDIRFIDWKSSARSHKLLVRRYLEDRNRAVHILVDRSVSGSFADKQTTINYIATLLMLVSHHVKDAVGLGLFTKTVEYDFPARVGRPYVLHLIKQLYTASCQNKETSLDELFKKIAQRHRKNTLICIISDFAAPMQSGLVQAASKNNDIIAIRCLAPREWTLPAKGYIYARDIEHGYKRYVSFNKQVTTHIQQWHTNQKQLLYRSGISLLDIEVGQPFISRLVQFLRFRFR